MKRVLAVLAGLIVAGIVTLLIETLGTYLFPLPEGADPMNDEWLKNNIDKIPIGAMACVALAHALGITVGMILAGAISRTSPIPAYIVSGLMIVATIVNLFMIPHPTWFMAVDILACLLGFFIGKQFIQNKIRTK
ncbi:hypothetical protein [Mangrovimonas aestuarii]|uniref:hypothetical protein n=1 Tax=Mangrovimonas aestuarii TaxID=3018443 RepID=UPI002378D37F|nr:hypothetical protein [Mangrovimonas aestuarii]